eukprot:scaffold101561_cov46-Cyclotella_meneghiniana.AAC.2
MAVHIGLHRHWHKFEVGSKCKWAYLVVHGCTDLKALFLDCKEGKVQGLIHDRTAVQGTDAYTIHNALTSHKPHHFMSTAHKRGITSVGVGVQGNQALSSAAVPRQLPVEVLIA